MLSRYVVPLLPRPLAPGGVTASAVCSSALRPADRAVNPRWTRELVDTMLGELRFKEPPAVPVSCAPTSKINTGWQCDWRTTGLLTPEHAAAAAAAASNALAEMTATATTAADNATTARPDLKPTPDLKQPQQPQQQPQPPPPPPPPLPPQQQQQQAAAEAGGQAAEGKKGGEDAADNGDAEAPAAKAGIKRSKPDTNDQASKKAKTGANKLLPEQQRPAPKTDLKVTKKAGRQGPPAAQDHSAQDYSAQDHSAQDPSAHHSYDLLLRRNPLPCRRSASGPRA